jgi:hypothetical protein
VPSLFCKVESRQVERGKDSLLASWAEHCWHDWEFCLCGRKSKTISFRLILRKLKIVGRKGKKNMFILSYPNAISDVPFSIVNLADLF